MRNEKQYVLKRYNGGNSKIVMLIDHEQFIRLFLLKNGQTLQERFNSSHHRSDVCFFVGNVLEEMNAFTAIYFWCKRSLGMITQENIALLYIKKEVKALEHKAKDSIDSMLLLIRGVDKLISTLNGRTK